MEYKDDQTTQRFVSSSMDNMQQQLNVAGCGVVVAAVAGDIGSKYDDHQHEEHDVGDDNESKYVKEVQQSEKQQTLKDFDDSEFTAKERAVCGSLLLDNGDDGIDKVGDGVDSGDVFDFGLDSNRSANGVSADYEILMHTKEEEHKMFDNVLPTYNNVADNTKPYTFDGMSANAYVDIIKADGDLSIASNFSESVEEDNVPQVDVKIENMIPHNCAPDQDAADEEEPSSLADNTTNETSSLSESAPQPPNDEQLLMCAIESRSIPVAMDDKENLTPSQLNPDAKEFVPSYGSNPTSPTSPTPIGGAAVYNKGGDPLFGEDAYPNIANRQLLPDDDEFVAESPRKGHAANLDNIALPAELTEFKHEADQRPHELQPDYSESEDEMVETTEVTTKQLDNNLMEYNQSLHGDFTNRMSSILLENGPGNGVQNIYDADVEQYVADSDDDGDVMKRSVYVANEEPIEDILNTVQLLPTDNESGNTSFVEEIAHAGEVELDIGMANKELLQVEEKEHVSHSPSTEEMYINLMSNELKLQPHEAVGMEHSFNNEALQQQPLQQQASTTTVEERKAEADAIVLSDSGNDQTNDIIMVEGDDDEEIFCAPVARDSSGMVFETSHDDHFSQEKDVETLTTTVIDLESEYNSNVDAGEAYKEEFERNLLNYVNEPLTDDQQQRQVEEHSPAKMEYTEMIGGNAYEDIIVLTNRKSCEVAVTAHPSETTTNKNQTVPVEDNTSEVKASEMLFSIEEEKPAALSVDPVKVEFGVEAHKDIYSEHKLSTEFNDFTKLSATEYSEEPVAKRTVAVECIQLDDIIETAATVAKEREEGELIDAAVIALESLTVRDETLQTLDKALGMDELEPIVPSDTHVDPVTVTAVAAAAAATAVVAAPAMVVVKKSETAKKTLAATSKPGTAAVSSKAKVGTKSNASAKSVGVGKKPSTVSTTIKSPTRGTVEAATKAAKPKVSATEKVATAAGSSERKTLKAITKTMPTVKQGASKATTTTSSVRAASAGTKSSAMGAKPGSVAIGQKSGASVTSAKARPTTAPSSTSTSIAPPKPTTLGLTVAANGTTSKPKMRSPRSTLTTQVRKAAATAAKSPVKAPPSAINGTSSKTVAAKTSTRASGVNSGSTTTTTNKVFTARPAPKFTTSNNTTTTATTKRTVTTTATLSVGNKTSTRSLSKTPPIKLTTTTTTTAAKANKTTPSKTSTMASKTKGATTGKVTPNKNAATQSPIAIKRPQQYQEDPKNKPIIMPLPMSITEETSQAVNGGANLATENKIDPQAFSHVMTNGDAQSLFTIDHDHKSPVPLADA